MRQQKTNSTRQGQPAAAPGFSLVEVLIAALIFAVGMIAVIGMQYTALGGYGNARDITQATQFGQRVVELMHLEAQNWTGGPTAGSRDLDFPYDEDLDGDGDDEVATNDPDSILEMADNSFDEWTSVFSEPLNTQLGSAPPAKYCVYVRGNMVSGGGLSSDSLQRVHLAVVYPGVGVNHGDECADTGSDLCSSGSSCLEPDPSDPPSTAETEGWRVVYMGTVVRERGYLS